MVAGPQADLVIAPGYEPGALDGVPPVPLKLYPEFEQMQLSRGVKAVTPTDLFYPDLSPRAPRLSPAGLDFRLVEHVEHDHLVPALDQRLRASTTT